MIELIVALVLALTSPLQITSSMTTGRVVYYGPSHDWSRIAELQGVEIPPGLTPIARPDCATLGSTGWIMLPGQDPLPWIQADCTATEDQDLVRSRNIVAEIPYPLASQVPGMIQGGWVEGTLSLDAPTAGTETGFAGNTRRGRPWGKTTGMSLPATSAPATSRCPARPW